MSPKRICVVTAGHLATCPRMVKAADALAEAGYAVRVVSTRFVGWAAEVDRTILARRPGWRWREVRYDWAGGAAARLTSALRRRLADRAARWLTAERLPVGVAARAFGRFHGELVRAAAEEPVDLVYAGTSGALAAGAAAARRLGVPFALDLEDFHSDERGAGAEAARHHALAARIEGALLPRARFLTAAGAGIAAEYARVYGVAVVPVSNTFPLPAEPPELRPSPGEALRLYWFSQTVGPGRGLEDAIAAAGQSGHAVELTLVGAAPPGYLAGLRALARRQAPALRLVHRPPHPDPIALGRGHDVGLGLERDLGRSRALCLSNKILCYPLSGLAVLGTDTAGQRPFLRDLGAGGVAVPVGDVPALAAAIARWAGDKARLAEAKRAAWAAAARRWHWEHAEERGALLAAVEAALSS